MSPLRDFACSCGHTFEARTRDPDDKPKCPQCLTIGGTVRLPSAPMGVVFRGSGFYATDYKNSRNQ